MESKQLASALLQQLWSSCPTHGARVALKEQQSSAGCTLPRAPHSGGRKRTSQRRESSVSLELKCSRSWEVPAYWHPYWKEELWGETPPLSKVS